MNLSVLYVSILGLHSLTININTGCLVNKVAYR